MVPLDLIVLENLLTLTTLLLGLRNGLALKITRMKHVMVTFAITKHFNVNLVVLQIEEFHWLNVLEVAFHQLMNVTGLP